MEKKRITAIVLAAGSGRRMNSETPKQFMEIQGYPVVYYSLKAFEDSPVDSVVLVTGKEDVEYCKSEIVDYYGFTKVQAVVAGGKERFYSVYEGLLAAGMTDYVLVHDGARPFLSQECICSSIEVVQKEEACVLSVPVKDTIKVADEEGYVDKTLERNQLWAIQTPQSFSFSLLKEAYHRLFAIKDEEKWPAITDDAMLVEYFLNQKVKLIHGDYRNIKITTPEDFAIAELFLKQNETDF